jgi:hypothetical protein
MMSEGWEGLLGVPVAFGKCCRAGPCGGGGGFGFGGGGFGGGFPGGGDEVGGGGIDCPGCVGDYWPVGGGSSNGEEDGHGRKSVGGCLGAMRGYGPGSDWASQCVALYRKRQWKNYDKFCHCIASCYLAKKCGKWLAYWAGVANEAVGDWNWRRCIQRYSALCKIPSVQPKPECCPDVVNKCCKRQTPYDPDDIVANQAGIACAGCPDCVKCCEGAISRSVG